MRLPQQQQHLDFKKRHFTTKIVKKDWTKKNIRLFFKHLITWQVLSVKNNLEWRPSMYIRYTFFFTHKQILKKLLHERRLARWLSKKYFCLSSKTLTADFLQNKKPKRLQKYLKMLKNYMGSYLKTFHNEDNENNSSEAVRWLRQTHDGKFPLLFFQPWKKIPFLPTERQQWLKITSNRYQKLRLKDRIDFFRTYIGQIFGQAYFRPNRKTCLFLDPEVEFNRSYSKFCYLHTKGWWYENLVQKKKSPRSARSFILDRPKTAFQIHWTQRKMEPWKNSLVFKRALYSGFGEDYRKENKFQLVNIKNYLRRKNPRHEKRNRLYKRGDYLWNNFRQRDRIRADKFARLKQIAGKITGPFYGHLRPKQITKIIKKSKKTKSKFLSWHEVILSRFEKRLDVVVYRLNLAPSILWARRLITAGLIFVTPAHSYCSWESMYHGLKKLSFPLKLRDPKNLYTKTYWTYTQENWVEFKFLGQPRKNISYLLQPGDLIQCAAGTSFNHFKTQSWLSKKPISAHLLVHKKKMRAWHFYFHKFEERTIKNWEQSSESVLTAIFLHSPQYRDLNSKDRIKESFLRWAML